VLRRRVELNRQNSNRKALQSHHASGGHAPAAAAAKQGGRGNRTKAKGDGGNAQNRRAIPRGKSRGRGKGDDAPAGVCFSFWRTGKCSTQGCKWEHRANPNPGRQENGSRASSRNSNAPKRPAGSIDALCKFFPLGTCRFGALCPFKHGAPAAAASSAPAAKADPAAKKKRRQRSKKRRVAGTPPRHLLSLRYTVLLAPQW
jgi:hypothetical protein